MIVKIYCQECSSYHEVELGMDKCPDCGSTLIKLLSLGEDDE